MAEGQEYDEGETFRVPRTMLRRGYPIIMNMLIDGEDEARMVSGTLEDVIYEGDYRTMIIACPELGGVLTVKHEVNPNEPQLVLFDPLLN